MFSQLDIPPERVILTYYPGGHMVYSDLPGLKAFLIDVRAFVSSVAVTSAALSGITPGRSSAQP
jgi:carboxypeptidase C (cathepsin A)